MLEAIWRRRHGEVYKANQVLSLNGSELPFPPRALKVLGYLLKHPGEVVSKQVLVDEVWNGTAVTDNWLSEVVRILRQTLARACNSLTWACPLAPSRSPRSRAAFAERKCNPPLQATRAST
ncbi:MAG: hypothetical protein E2P02_14790 [Acidobacteria bacterium]|nr:MAG: hypothetical protein E2P02_14790 [Acidobacteriota bacterium]